MNVAKLPKSLNKGQLFTPLVIQLLMILFLIEFVKGSLLVTVLPVYINRVLGLSALTVGWAFALQYAGDNLFRTPAGWIVDRSGYRLGIVAGTIIAVLSVFMLAFARNALWVIAASAMLGIGTSPLWPSVIAGVTEEAGEDARGTIMSIVYGAWLTGTGLGPVVINFFIRGSTYRPAFWFLIGILAFVLAVALLVPNKGYASLKKRKLHVARAHKLSSPSMLQRMRQYIHEVNQSLRVSRLFYLALLMQNLSIGLLAPVITLYAKDVLQLSNVMYSLFLVIGGGITVSLLYPVGKIVDRWGTRWLLHIGFLLSGIMIAIFPLTQWRLVVWTMVGFIGVSFALIIPAWNAFIASLVPEEKRGFIWGMFLTIEGCGMIIGSVSSGKLWDDLGPGAPFVLSGVAMLTLFVLHLFISKPQKIMVR